MDRYPLLCRDQALQHIHLRPNRTPAPRKELLRQRAVLHAVHFTTLSLFSAPFQSNRERSLPIR